MFAWMMHLRLHCHVVDSLLWHVVEFWKLEALNLAEKAMLGPRIGGSAVESNSCFPAFGHMVHWGVLRNMIEVNFSIRKDGEQKWHGLWKGRIWVKDVITDQELIFIHVWSFCAFVLTCSVLLCGCMSLFVWVRENQRVWWPCLRMVISFLLSGRSWRECLL